MRSLRVALVVQGEGRGHMTQALALARFLEDAGHEITRVFVGVSPHRAVPDYFVDGFAAPVIRFDAPTQVPDKDRRGVSVSATTIDTVRRMPRFIEAGVEIHKQTVADDVVVNFLDIVGGASRLVMGSRVPAVAIAHNYLFAHPELADAPGRPHARGLVRLYTELTALKATTRVALSFVAMSSATEPDLRVAPPLLRPGLDQLEPHDGGYLLAYALNAGYGDLLADWQSRSEGVTVHCYIDGGGGALTRRGATNFHAHELDQSAFVEHLAGCRAYVGSAGFESLCEAFFLGKPVLAVPTEGQLEQSLNAWDAERCGVARAGTYADLDAFWSAPPIPDATAVAEFREWVTTAPDTLVNIIESAAATNSGRRNR